MTKEEIRAKAIECAKDIVGKCKQTVCELCPTYLDCRHFTDINCSPYLVWAYEHGFADGVEQAEAVRLDIAKECRYLLNSGMGKQKSLEHLIRILEKERKKND